MTEAEDIRIRGEFTSDPNVCRFGVNRDLLPRDDGSLLFRSVQEGLGSPLVDALFSLEGVASVRVTAGALVITKDSPEAWPKLAKAMLPLLKDVLMGEGPLLSEEAIAKLDEAPDTTQMTEVITRLLQEQINPALASHGGWVRLVRVEDADVFVELGGGCQGCAASKMTLKNSIEASIRDALPQVRNVIDVTDHESGTNPYYT